MLSCQDSLVGEAACQRLRSLYGKNLVHFSPMDPTCPLGLESVFVKALDTFGEVNLVVNSTANTPLQLSRNELDTSDLASLEARLDSRQQQEDVQGLRRMGRLAVKYMGRHHGFQGGTLLNLASCVELQDRCMTGSCTVLGTTRALGLSSRVNIHGVKTATVYEPVIDYPDVGQAAQLTDQHQSTVERRKSFIQCYTGYMALHMGDTAYPGSSWAFNKHMRLEEVQQDSLQKSCGITNKMCYWTGCPMVKELEDGLVDRQTDKIRGVQEQLAETQD